MISHQDKNNNNNIHPPNHTKNAYTPITCTTILSKDWEGYKIMRSNYTKKRKIRNAVLIGCVVVSVLYSMMQNLSSSMLRPNNHYHDNENEQHDYDKRILYDGRNSNNETLCSSSSSTSTSQPKKQKILVGIFSMMDSPIEYERRQMIRSTWLSYYQSPHHYKNNNNKNLGINSNQTSATSSTSSTSSFYNRICSLNDYSSSLDNNNNKQLVDDCQIIYTFVVGSETNRSNMKVPTERLDDDDVHHHGGLTIHHHNQNITSMVSIGEEEKKEKDITYLNIRENMNEGKSLTWFHYASSLFSSNSDQKIDLIAKADTDTVVFPEELLRQIDTSIHQIEEERKNEGSETTPVPKVSYYGGYRVGLQSFPKQPYMQGGFYFLSPNLATFITSSKKCSNQKDIISDHAKNRNTIRVEDSEIGWLVARCQHNFGRNNTNKSNTNHEQQQQSQEGEVRLLKFNMGTAWHHHDSFKSSKAFKDNWYHHVAKEEAHTTFEGLLLNEKEKRQQQLPSSSDGAATDTGCPSEDAILATFPTMIYSRSKEMIMNHAHRCEAIK